MMDGEAGNISWNVALRAFRSVSAEDLMFPVLLQLIVIIVSARLCASLLRRFGQPGVVGEIAAGLILGPSVLGALFPQFSQMLFHPPLHGVPIELSDVGFKWIFSTIAHLGLILLLFLIGLEFDFSHLKVNSRAALAISLTGVVLPFGLGVLLAPWILPHLEQHPEATGPIPALGLALFLGTALSITAIPILGRIMLEMNITRTRLGTLTISSAAIDDAAGWILLATVAALVKGKFAILDTLLMLGETLAFAAFMIWGVRPLLRTWARKAGAERNLSLTDLAVLFCILFGCAIVTNRIGIFAIFGAFLLGAVLSEEVAFREAAARKLRDFVMAFFLPIFFTYTGLRTNIGSLETATQWMLCGLVLLAAIAGKFGGCLLAARWSGFPWRDAACIGTLMNTRALMELIVINIGYDLQVIPPSLYCMLVLMALVTTFMTTPILIWLMPGTEIEPCIRNSEFQRFLKGSSS